MARVRESTPLIRVTAVRDSGWVARITRFLAELFPLSQTRFW